MARYYGTILYGTVLDKEPTEAVRDSLQNSLSLPYYEDNTRHWYSLSFDSLMYTNM